MTAQQQLAELMQTVESRDERTDGRLWTIQAAVFLRDNGPAIAELMQAAKMVGSFPTEDRLNRLDAALRKLTQDA